MKKTIASLFLCTLLTTSVAFAAAVPTSGNTGVINTPHAYPLHGGKFSVNHTGLYGEDTLSKVNVGINDKLEVGLTINNINTTDEVRYGSFKYQLVKGTLLTPAIAVGAIDVSDKYSRNAYIVASKTLPLDVRVSIGVAEKGEKKVFGSVEKTFTPLFFVPNSKNLFPTTTVKAEYDGYDYNYGISLATVPGLKVDAGYRSQRIYLGATFTYN